MKIGIFDSGAGGYAVRNILEKELGKEHTLYLYTDHKNFPYGTKTREEITLLSLEAIKHLVGQGCEIVVLACNTVTLAARPRLCTRYPYIRFISVVPPLTLAEDLTTTKNITILASKYTNDVLPGYGLGINYHKVVATSLIQSVEEWILDGVLVEQEIHRLMQSSDTSDVVILGCTHFIHLKPLFERLYPEKIFLDGTEQLSERLKEFLA